MTSFGATTDNSINIGSGPYVFKVTGQIFHRIGSLCPPLDNPPRFLQMYVYDTEHEIANRLSLFGENASSCLNVDVVKSLINILNENNELVKVFRTARDICLSLYVPDFVINLHSSFGERNYDNLAPGVIGGIVFEDQPNSSKFDIVIHMKGDMPKRISKLHSLYMALQYPLLYVYGEEGWHPKLHLLMMAHVVVNLP
ncbi:uncharacterized protein LOC143556621 [Bidens hawaiensis]|uniref:uncharacterized protein LOC143556621 n=1 Tax=Bidens hawaiensis TaxID=980011 RepID=UPI00404AA310